MKTSTEPHWTPAQGLLNTVEEMMATPKAALCQKGEMCDIQLQPQPAVGSL